MSLEKVILLLDPTNRHLMYCTLASEEQNVNLLRLQVLDLFDSGIEFPSLKHLEYEKLLITMEMAPWLMLICQ